MPGELRVLVAEDHSDIREMLGRLLEAEGCQVSLCSNGTQALEQIAQDAFHLILSDIAMPGASGLDLLARSSSVAIGIPVVLISGYIDLETALFAVRHGAFDCLLKPFRLDDVRDLVRRVKVLHGLTENGDEGGVTPPLESGAHRPQEALIRHSRALQLIARSGKVLGETQGFGHLMGAILDAAMRGAGAKVGALLMLSEADQRLRVTASRGFDNAVRPGDTVERVDELWGLAGLSSKIASSVVPLTVKGQQVGVMAMAGCRHAESFSIVDREMLDILAQQASMALENTSLYETVETSVFEGMRALVATIEAKDPYTEGHSLRVAGTAIEICRQMGLGGNVEDLLRYAGALHDVGKVGIPDAILGKPGKLTPEEYERMQEHPAVGWKILMPFTFLREEATVVKHHHEWMNGKGYPDGLQGAEIPLAARILAVADAYDAITTVRPYRAPRGHEAAIEELRRCVGFQFDPDIVEAITVLPSTVMSPTEEPVPCSAKRSF